jgi:alanyl-tRNA synthetase
LDFLQKGNLCKSWKLSLILLDQTPFYAEMGGQVGDTGVIKGNHAKFQALDSISPYKGLIAHKGKVEHGTIKLGDTVTAAIDSQRRQKIANNHTATHLLHWALQEVLGEHIKQAGSVVDPQRLRFDFSHHKPLSAQEVRQIEDLINAKIRENLPVRWYEIKYEEAQQRQDIKQFFGEKYGSSVRVIDIDYSKELCGGTHTNAVGNIGLFRIVKESSIAAGIRRIEAVTGEEAEQLARQSEDLVLDIATLLKAQPQQLKERVEKLLEENKQLTQEIKNARKAQLTGLLDQLMGKSEKIGHIPLLTGVLPLTAEELRLCADQAMDRLLSGVVLLAMEMPEKCHIIVKVSDDFVSRGISANEIVKTLAPVIEGSGGGKNNAAQAGGKAPQKIGEAIARTREYLANKQ